MNRKRLNLNRPRRLLLLAGVAALAAPAAHAAVEEELEADDGVIAVTSDAGTVTANRIVVRDGGSDWKTTTEQHEIEVIIEDGETTVRVDGEEVPPERIRKIRGGLVVIDEDGQEIETIRIGIGGDDEGRGLWQYWIGSDDTKRLRFEPADEPKVMIGIHLDEPGAALLRHLRLEPGATTLVQAVHVGLPAHEAGLDEFDVIVKIDGQTPANPDTLRAVLAEKEPGDVIALQVIHEGEPETIGVTLDAYDARAMAEAELIGEAPAADTGSGLFWLDEEMVAPRWGGLPADRERLRDFFIDEQNRIFEFRPRLKMKMRGDAEEEAEVDEELEARLRRLDERLAELDKLLTDLLERTKKAPRD